MADKHENILLNLQSKQRDRVSGVVCCYNEVRARHPGNKQPLLKHNHFITSDFQLVFGKLGE
jgi:hypothetical protein